MGFNEHRSRSHGIRDVDCVNWHCNEIMGEDRLADGMTVGDPNRRNCLCVCGAGDVP